MTESGQPPSILLLEDSAFDAELITLQLKADGIGLPVARATTKQEYQALLTKPGVALVLSDFSLPGYDGFSALELARQVSPEIPFIFVSGAIGEERAIETIRRGATDYVLKDRLERLGPAVRRALSEAEMRRLRDRAEHERDQLLVSERQAREAAEAANRMKDEFLAIVSHELRTPLNAILGWASLLTLGNVAAGKRQRGLEAIGRNARIQARIIDDILDVSRIVSGKLALHRSPVNISSFVSSAVDAVRPKAAAKNIELRVEIPEGGDAIDADGERLQQVVWNLVTNAVKFTPVGGVIRVSADIVDDQLVLQVEDSGAGIEREFLPHVFEAFRQGDASKTRAHRGLGLGLAIVKRLVLLHGGRVEADSRGPGQGARFTVFIPASGASVTPEAQAPPESERNQFMMDAYSPDLIDLLSGVRVLVVDDDVEARDIASELLSASGAQVLAVGSVQEALQQVPSFRPQVVVSDIGMPQVDGYTLIRELRTLAPGSGGSIPAIALTAYARDVDRAEAELAGYQRHLAKPVAPRALIVAVAELLGCKADQPTPTR